MSKNVNLKEVKEQRNEALNTMKQIHSDYEGKELSKEAKDKWNEAKETYEAKNSIVQREEFLEKNRAEEANSATSSDNKKVQKYNFTDAINYAINPSKLSAEKRSFYQEISEKGEFEASKAGVTLQGGQGVTVPSSVLNAVTVTTEGEDTVFEEEGSFISKLRERSIMGSMGADFLTNLSGDIKFPRENSIPNAVWEGEVDENTEGTPTFDNVKLSPKRLSLYVDVSNQMLKQTSPSVQNRIENQLIDTALRGLEKTAIIQTSAGAPQGIYDLTSNDLAIESGSVSDYRELVVDLETEVAVDNADIGSLGYYTNPKMRGKLKKTVTDAGSGRFVWEGSELNGYQAGVSSLMPSDFTQDTVTGCEGIIFGNWNDVIFGTWGAMEILIDPYTQARKGTTRLILNLYADVSILRPYSFSVAKVKL